MKKIIIAGCAVLLLVVFSAVLSSASGVQQVPQSFGWADKQAAYWTAHPVDKVVYDHFNPTPIAEVQADPLAEPNTDLKGNQLGGKGVAVQQLTEDEQWLVDHYEQPMIPSFVEGTP